MLPAASAQAIVDDKGSLSASLSQDFGFADRILESGGAAFPNQYVNNFATTLGVEYVPLDKLAVTATLPLIALKYDQEKSGSDYDPHGPYDDGSYHLTLQDLRADVRYMVLPSPFAVAFNVGLTLPVADYPVQGSAAPGRGLTQGRIGVATSWAPSFLVGSFLNLGYELTLSEKFDATPDTEQFSQTRSEASLQTGYFINDKLGVFVMSSVRIQHDGIDFVDWDMLTPSQQTYHDPILKESALLVGLGGMYQLNDKLFVSASYAHFITGRNTLDMNFFGLALGWDVL